MKRGTYWVCFIDKNCFGSYGSAVLKNFLEYLKTKHGKCIYPDYIFQKNPSDKYCSYNVYFTPL